MRRAALYVCTSPVFVRQATSAPAIAIGLDDPIPLEAPNEDLSDCRYTLMGTISQQGVNDDRYMQTRFRPTLAVTSRHDIGASVDWGTNINRSRVHTIGPYVAAEVDHGRRLRNNVTRAHNNSWGFVIPHLMRLYTLLARPPSPPGAKATSLGSTFYALALTTGAAQAATQTQLFTKEAVRREFEFELHSYMYILEDTLQTTATPTLLSLFLRMHVDLGIDFESTSKRHRHRRLLRRVLEELSVKLDAAVDAHSQQSKTDERGHAREARQLLDVANDANAFLEKFTNEALLIDADARDEKELESVLVSRRKVTAAVDRLQSAVAPPKLASEPTDNIRRLTQAAA